MVTARARSVAKVLLRPERRSGLWQVCTLYIVGVSQVPITGMITGDGSGVRGRRVRHIRIPALLRSRVWVSVLCSSLRLTTALSSTPRLYLTLLSAICCEVCVHALSG